MLRKYLITIQNLRHSGAKKEVTGLIHLLFYDKNRGDKIVLSLQRNM